MSPGKTRIPGEEYLNTEFGYKIFIELTIMMVMDYAGRRNILPSWRRAMSSTVSIAVDSECMHDINCLDCRNCPHGQGDELRRGIQRLLWYLSICYEQRISFQRCWYPFSSIS